MVMSLSYSPLFFPSLSPTSSLTLPNSTFYLFFFFFSPSLPYFCLFSSTFLIEFLTLPFAFFPLPPAISYTFHVPTTFLPSSTNIPSPSSPSSLSCLPSSPCTFTLPPSLFPSHLLGWTCCLRSHLSQPLTPLPTHLPSPNYLPTYLYPCQTDYPPLCVSLLSSSPLHLSRPLRVSRCV